jgi:hypothetical protein
VVVRYFRAQSHTVPDDSASGSCNNDVTAAPAEKERELGRRNRDWTGLDDV